MSRKSGENVTRQVVKVIAIVKPAVGALATAIAQPVRSLAQFKKMGEGANTTQIVRVSARARRRTGARAKVDADPALNRALSKKREDAGAIQIVKVIAIAKTAAGAQVILIAKTSDQLVYTYPSMRVFAAFTLKWCKFNQSACLPETWLGMDSLHVFKLPMHPLHVFKLPITAI